MSDARAPMRGDTTPDRPEVLLTVSGTIAADLDAQIARGERPRADYRVLGEVLPADVIDYAKAEREGGTLASLVRKVAGRNALLAFTCWKRRADYRVLFTDGEQVGIPLALLLKWLGRGRSASRHVMIVHTLSVPKKQLFFDWLGLATHVDRFLVYATWQKRFIEERWKVPPERVVFTPFMVDDRFYAAGRVAPDARSVADRPMICAVGLERRDYGTLMEAVRDLPADVVIAAASPWSKQEDETSRAAIPPNVTVRKFAPRELRALYAASAFTVMPLHDVTFQAGVTALLEAMAMERAVICTRTPGQTDVVVEGESGTYVPPYDAAALRNAIVRLLHDPEEARRMGRNGRRIIEERMNLDHYATRLHAVVTDAGRRAAAARPSP